jgi:hypothetical protein
MASAGKCASSWRIMASGRDGSNSTCRYRTNTRWRLPSDFDNGGVTTTACLARSRAACMRTRLLPRVTTAHSTQWQTVVVARRGEALVPCLCQFGINRCRFSIIQRRMACAALPSGVKGPPRCNVRPLSCTHRIVSPVLASRRDFANSKACEDARVGIPRDQSERPAPQDL